MDAGSHQPTGESNTDDEQRGGLVLTKRSVISVSLALLAGALAIAFSFGYWAAGVINGLDQVGDKVGSLNSSVQQVGSDLASIDRRLLTIESSRFTLQDAHDLERDVTRNADRVESLLDTALKASERLSSVEERLGSVEVEQATLSEKVNGGGG